LNLPFQRLTEMIVERLQGRLVFLLTANSTDR